MRFLIGCILGLAALAPLSILSARALSIPMPPTTNPWCQAGKLGQQTER
jgi:hypothetical protein